LLGLSVSAAAVSCAEDRSTDGHAVYFVGYVYDGASGKRLAASEITAISLKYRDNVIHTKIESDGRFVTQDPLPTWQDYSVFVGAQGYRPFVSNNPGFDVPKSLAMTNGLAGTATIQTFQIDAHLFPLGLKAPKLTINIEKSDAAVSVPAPARASGSIRLRPQSISFIERGSADINGQAIQSRWPNDEDLLNQTLTRTFTDGTVEIAEGELSYGVAYEVTIFDVAGYQPTVRGGAQGLVAGVVTSASVPLQPDLKEPLRILSTTAENCLPPASTAADYGASIDVVFSEEIEPVGATFAEDVDNGLNITFPSTGGFSTCGLKPSVDATKQERGSRVVFSGKVMTLSFNPSIGLATVASGGFTCTAPTAISAVIYSGLSNLMVRPKNDAVRKRSLSAMLVEMANPISSSSISCPARASTF
jgi:hypothetical protein